MQNNKIILSLWFTSNEGRLENIIKYYKEVFSTKFESGPIIPLGETPGGNAEMCEVKIFDQSFSFLSTSEKHHPLNDAVSLIINCNDQKEIDRYWNYFTAVGEESMCGWCIDKFGLRWQVLPKNLGELMTIPGAGDIMMKQKKIVIEEYLR